MKMKKKVHKNISSSSVHPLIVSDHHYLSILLPAAIFSLTLSLSQQDKHVLAYLLSSSSSSTSTLNNKKTTKADHPPVFSCKCFSCYMSYWALWDSSPNQNLIHHIIDAFEDITTTTTTTTITTLLLHKNTRTKKGRKNKLTCGTNEQEAELTQLNESETVVADDECEEQEQEVEQRQEQGSVRKLVNFLWSVWT